MDMSEEPEKEAESGPEDVEAIRDGVQPADGIYEVPLFLRGISDGRKGDAQDEKDETGE
jgi:hypothetical protein